MDDQLDDDGSDESNQFSAEAKLPCVATSTTTTATTKAMSVQLTRDRFAGFTFAAPATLFRHWRRGSNAASH